MTSPMALPPKEEVAKEIGKAANTLSDEMQTAVLTKARELGFDLNKGRLTLEETMINLTHNRDLLIAASRTGKLSQLPLKLQYSLYTQVRDISGVLTSIVNGTDAVLNLEDAVEDLTSSVWQYNLHNLSSEVLGFQEKMNQLKSQETLIRRVHREAQDFQTTLAHSQDVLSAIEDVLAQSTQRRDEIQSSVDQVATIAAKAIDSEQKIAAHATQAEQHNSATERHEAGARTADATAQAFAEKIPKLQSEIDEKQSALKQLIDQAREALDGFQNASEKSAAAFASQYDELKSSTDSQLRRILGDIEQAKSEAKASTDELRNDTRSQLDTMQSTQDSKVEATIKNLIRATSYSPTHSRVQYHRGCRA
jgi:chromosome segregation ATPase